MTGFYLPTSGIRSDHSANWATTTALILLLFVTKNSALKMLE